MHLPLPGNKHNNAIYFIFFHRNKKRQIRISGEGMVNGRYPHESGVGNCSKDQGISE